MSGDPNECAKGSDLFSGLAESLGPRRLRGSAQVMWLEDGSLEVNYAGQPMDMFSVARLLSQGINSILSNESVRRTDQRTGPFGVVGDDMDGSD